MKLRILAIAALALSAAPAALACDATSLQQTVNLMVSLGEHGDGADIAEAIASIDEQTKSCPADPYVLKAAALARATLADVAAKKEDRLKLRQQALADFDRSADLVTPANAPQRVMMNGQAAAIGFADNVAMRQALVDALAEDR